MANEAASIAAITKKPLVAASAGGVKWGVQQSTIKEEARYPVEEP